MDEKVTEQEKSAMNEYFKHQVLSSSKPIKYDLKSLNTDFFTTTSDPWDDLISGNEPLPDSFSENMLSALSVKNEKYSRD